MAKLRPELTEAQKQPRHQLHIPISIAPWQVTWGDQPKGEATKGLMMVDMGAAITLLIKKWADAHGLTMKEKEAEYISGANRMAVKIVGMTSMTLLLAPTLELDVANVAVCLDDFCEGLLRCDLLCRHKKAPCTATLTLPGPD